MAQIQGGVERGAGSVMVIDRERVTAGWQESPGACSPGAVVGLAGAGLGWESREQLRPFLVAMVGPAQRELGDCRAWVQTVCLEH